MGYSTVKEVKQCFTYADAKYVHDKTKPIRGRSPDIRPLGQRRDADTYSVRMHGENVEFVLYKTPVVTYLPGGDVVIKTDGWSSISTHQFIEQVLGVRCYGSRRSTVMEARSAEGDVHKYIIPKDKGITMIHAGGNWRITQFNTLYEYRLNRKAANAVRKQYADFLRYIKGMVNLRSEMVEPHRWARRQKPYAAVVISAEELPQQGRAGTIHGLKIEFEELLRADQPEDTRHLSYNKAFALAVQWALSLSRSNSVNLGTVKLPAEEVLGLIDELLLRAHAQEILVWTELKTGQVPTGKYKGWMPERG
jgi:hypothetical protein